MTGQQSELRDAGADETPKKTKRRWWFRLAAVLMGLLPLLACELGLRAFGIGRPTGYVDPFVGFSRVHPLFELDDAQKNYRTVHSRERFFGAQSFAAKKPEGAFRAFCLGGSTVRGRPYETDSAFSSWLEVELNGMESDRVHEVVNCGGLSYASYRLLPILEEVLQYEPDVIVVATGHNEFLEDRTYKSIKNRSGVAAWLQDRAYSLRTVTAARQMLGADSRPKKAGQVADDGKTVLADDVDARLDQASGYASYHFDEEWKQQVDQHFDTSLRAMVRICKLAQVPLIFVRLGSNLRDCPPFKSEHPPDILPEQETAWRREFEAAAKQEFRNPEATLKHLRAAEAVSETHPLMLFRLARCLDRMGRIEEARTYYHRAKDRDVCPLRMTTQLSATLVNVATETQTPLIDEHSEIESLAKDRLPGGDWYMDHVHPTIAAHQLVAQMLAQQMVKMKLVDEAADWTSSARRKYYASYFDQIGGERFLADGGRRVQWLENWARRQKLLDETLPDTPRAHLHFGFRQFEFAVWTLSYNSLRTALDQDPQLGHDVLEFAYRLFESGRANDALTLLKVFDEGEYPDDIIATARFARIVLAVELDDEVEMNAAIDKCADCATVAPSDSQWKQPIPDAVDRAQAGKQ
jgi:lysophospholipase L1-like esterase